MQPLVSQPQIIFLISQPQPQPQLQPQLVMINHQVHTVDAQPRLQLQEFYNQPLLYPSELPAVQVNNMVEPQSEDITQKEQVTTPEITESKPERVRLDYQTRKTIYSQLREKQISEKELRDQGLSNRQISYLKLDAAVFRA